MPRVVALVADLMDRSRISASLPDAEFAKDPDATADAEVVIVDLGRHADAVADVRATSPGAFLVAYGSHVDEQVLADAQDAGADRVLPRSRFFHDPAAAVARPE